MKTLAKFTIELVQNDEENIEINQTCLGSVEHIIKAGFLQKSALKEDLEKLKHAEGQDLEDLIQGNLFSYMAILSAAAGVNAGLRLLPNPDDLNDNQMKFLSTLLKLTEQVEEQFENL